MNIFSKKIQKRFNEISLLLDNWDGYNGSPPSKETIKLAKDFLLYLPKWMYNKLYYDDITPSPYGTIFIEWEYKDFFVEIEIGENGSGFISELPMNITIDNDKLNTLYNPYPKDFIYAMGLMYSDENN